jgi:hypothetical protein
MKVTDTSERAEWVLESLDGMHQVDMRFSDEGELNKYAAKHKFPMEDLKPIVPMKELDRDTRYALRDVGVGISDTEAMLNGAKPVTDSILNKVRSLHVAYRKMSKTSATTKGLFKLFNDLNDVWSKQGSTDKGENSELEKAFAELEKGKGEGSRGGKVIGHTRSGKPIYEDHKHASHAKFTSADHDDAVSKHETAYENHKEAAAEADDEEDDASYDEHSDLAEQHKAAMVHHSKESDKKDKNPPKVKLPEDIASHVEKKTKNKDGSITYEFNDSSDIFEDLQDLEEKYKDNKNMEFITSRGDDVPHSVTIHPEKDTKKSEQSDLNKAYKTLGI